MESRSILFPIKIIIDRLIDNLSKYDPLLPTNDNENRLGLCVLNTIVSLLYTWRTTFRFAFYRKISLDSRLIHCIYYIPLYTLYFESDYKYKYMLLILLGILRDVASLYEIVFSLLVFEINLKLNVITF